MLRKRSRNTEHKSLASTRLFSAVQARDKNEVTNILSHAGDYDVDQDSISLAFTTAVQIGNPEIVGIFIETGHIHIDYHDLMFDETALMHSVRNGHLPLVKYLLQNNANINESSFQTGKTALHACVSGPEKTQADLEVLDYLLQNDRIDIEARDRDDETPLMKASGQLKVPAIKRLLDAGSNMYAIHGRSGQCAIHFCFLSEYFSSHYPLVVAECFRLFLNHGIDPNFKDQHGVPLLGYAVKSNKYQILCLLLYINCDINIVYRETSRQPYNTALYYACQRKELRSILTLIEAGCEIFNLYDTISQTLKEITHGTSDISNSPRKLKEMCRIKIRKVLGIYPHKSVGKLGLPKSIRDYIILKDIFGDIDFKEL